MKASLHASSNHHLQNIDILMHQVKNDLPSNWFYLTWLNLTWLQLTWLQLTWLQLTWLDLNWIDLTWFELTYLFGMTWLDLTWLTWIDLTELMLWLDFTRFDFTWLILMWLDLNWPFLQWSGLTLPYRFDWIDLIRCTYVYIITIITQLHR